MKADALGLVKNHPFLDGNKRVGFMAVALFLEVNGLSFGASEEEAVVYTRALAAGEIGAKEYVVLFSEEFRVRSRAFENYSVVLNLVDE